MDARDKKIAELEKKIGKLKEEKKSLQQQLRKKKDKTITLTEEQCQSLSDILGTILFPTK